MTNPLADIEGLYAYRLKDSVNDREVTFAEAWKQQVQSGVLHRLLNNPTKEDAKVVATIMQWLGSNVGISFLREAVKNNDNIKRYLELK